MFCMVKNITIKKDPITDNVEVNGTIEMDLVNYSNILHNLSLDDFVVHEMNFMLRSKVFYANPTIECFIRDIYADPEKGVIVVKWADKTVTKVKVDSADNWDLEAGVNAAIVKRLYKSHNAFKNFITKNTTYIQRKKKEKK